MPTYDLNCRRCGHRFESFLMRFLKEADKVCPKCGSEQVTVGVGGGFFTQTGKNVVGCSFDGGFG